MPVVTGRPGGRFATFFILDFVSYLVQVTNPRKGAADDRDAVNIPVALTHGMAVTMPQAACSLRIRARLRNRNNPVSARF
jgi:hypothetical protein